jgi:hypothetical protein
MPASGSKVSPLNLLAMVSVLVEGAASLAPRCETLQHGNLGPYQIRPNDPGRIMKLEHPSLISDKRLYGTGYPVFPGYSQVVRDRSARNPAQTQLNLIKGELRAANTSLS